MSVITRWRTTSWRFAATSGPIGSEQNSVDDGGDERADLPTMLVHTEAGSAGLSTQGLMMFDGWGGYGATAIIYLLVHFFLYVVVLRHRCYFQTEKGIFLYHLISTIGWGVAAAVIVLVGRD